jgi:Peptidase propeptide and YPEB domain
MKLSPVPAAALLAALALPACGGGTGPGASYDPPTTEFATTLGIETPPPVTEEEAKAIAAEAAGGTATSVSSETENGQLIYEVQVRTPDGDMEVEVFASNGGVAEIEPAD